MDSTRKRENTPPETLKNRLNKKILRAQILLGSILFILGAGNLFFAQNRADYYQSHLHKALLEQGMLTSEPPSTQVLVPKNRTLSRHIEHLKARHSFYRFCMLGGKVLLSLGGVVLLSALILYKSMNITVET